MPGTWTHLAGRFFGTLTGRPLQPAEIERVNSWLLPGEPALFWAQPIIDQRHGFDTAATITLDASETVRAALLHDIGKRYARLGVWGRSWASFSIKLRLPLGRRARTYRSHGRLAAWELARLGSTGLVVDFAAAHHRHRPDTIAQATWKMLKAADDGHGPGGAVD